jgi:hypothetical protein
MVKNGPWPMLLLFKTKVAAHPKIQPENFNSIEIITYVLKK